jgi:hypothetical protein
MRASEIEMWVHRIAMQVEKRQHTEDSRVELKAQWPSSAEDAARRIGGHANASHGEPILWVIGLDEDRGVVGAEPQELSDWFAKVKACFDGICPDLRDLNVPIQGKIVVALLFNTERAPYVVRNPAFGKSGAGPVRWEVPWREARSTTTARREHLMRLLAPVTQQPETEPLAIELAVREELRPSEDPILRWYLTGGVYVIPRSQTPIVFPFHRCSLTVKLGEQPPVEDWELFLLSNTPGWSLSDVALPSTQIEVGSSEVTVFRPGTVTLNIARSETRPMPSAWPQRASGVLRLPAIGALTPNVIEFELAAVNPKPSDVARWQLHAVSESIGLPSDLERSR